MTLRVQAGGERWLADVGFGLGLLEPLPWGDTGPHTQGGWAYRLVAVGERTWQVRERQGETWTALYRFSEEPQHASDVVVANYFTSNHPSSPFVGRPVVIRKEPHSRLRLHGRQLSLTRPDGERGAPAHRPRARRRPARGVRPEAQRAGDRRAARLAGGMRAVTVSLSIATSSRAHGAGANVIDRPLPRCLRAA